MSVSAVISSSAANSAAGKADVSRTPAQTLGQDDFLKLLVTQMTSQDPMNPQSDADFIAQMAQFSSLEQAKTLSTQVSQLNSQQQFAQAAALLGRNVQVQTGTTTTDQGIVSAVMMNAGVPQLVINGASYDLSQVLSITPAPVASP